MDKELEVKRGAGRPPSRTQGVNLYVQLSVKMRPGEMDALRAAAKCEGLSLRALILKKCCGIDADYADGYAPSRAAITR